MSEIVHVTAEAEWAGAVYTNRMSAPAEHYDLRDFIREHMRQSATVSVRRAVKPVHPAAPDDLPVEITVTRCTSESELEPERTTKLVTAMVQFTFHGDYIDAGDVTGYAEQWLDSGLDDRDDLRGWTATFGPVTEMKGDPLGLDS